MKLFRTKEVMINPWVLLLLAIIYSFISFALLMFTTGGWAGAFLFFFGLIWFGSILLTLLFLAKIRTLLRKGAIFISFSSLYEVGIFQLLTYIFMINDCGDSVCHYVFVERFFERIANIIFGIDLNLESYFSSFELLFLIFLSLYIFFTIKLILEFIFGIGVLKKIAVYFFKIKNIIAVLLIVINTLFIFNSIFQYYLINNYYYQLSFNQLILLRKFTSLLSFAFVLIFFAPIAILFRNGFLGLRFYRILEILILSLLILLNPIMLYVYFWIFPYYLALVFSVISPFFGIFVGFWMLFRVKGVTNNKINEFIPQSSDRLKVELMDNQTNNKVGIERG